MLSPTMFKIVFLEGNISMWNKFEVYRYSSEYGYGHEDANKNELYIFEKVKKDGNSSRNLDVWTAADWNTF